MKTRTQNTIALKDDDLEMVAGGRLGRGIARFCDDLSGLIGRLFRTEAPAAPIEAFISNPPL